MSRLYRKRPRPASCSVCGVPSGTGQPILHFNLLRFVYKPDGRYGSRGAGAIDLCEPCWKRVTQRSMIRRRPAKAAAA